jgi:hypothetical protein
MKTKHKRRTKTSIPASESWLYRNMDALAAVHRGLQEAAEGKSVYAGSFAVYADERGEI